MNAAATQPLHSSSQSHASDPTLSCWISASAGTGKTKTLIDRIARLLLRGVSPNNILALTYTKAAAHEMKERLLSRLQSWAIMPTEALLAELEELTHSKPGDDLRTKAVGLFKHLLTPGQDIKIQTIHSYCQTLLSTFPIEAGISPHFIILSDDEIQKILKKAISFALQDPLAQIHFSALGLIMAESTIKELISEFLQKRTQWHEILRHYGTLEAYLQMLGIHLNINANLPPYDLKNILRIANKLEESDSSTQNKLGAALREQITLKHDPTHAFFTNDGSPKKRLCTTDFQRAHPDDYALLLESQEIGISHKRLQSNRNIYSKTSHFLYSATATLRVYEAIKAEAGTLDYNDLIERTITLLNTPGTSEWVSYKLGSRIEHILVDEAQDTNPLQWELIKTLAEAILTPDTRDNTLFVVGDIKQSIYSFQGARPLLFHHLESYFQDFVLNNDGAWLTHSMNTSYRSTSPILEVVDHVFGHTPINLSDTHTLEVQHHAHRKQAPGRVALWPLVSKPEREEFVHEWALPIKRIHEDSIHMNLAQHIADHIQKLLNSREILPSTGKPIEPQDILILVEKRSHMIQHLSSLLSELSIPVESSSKLLLREQLPIMDLIALGRFLINPEDDYSLACILKSPLINDGKGISEETLLMLCYDRPVSLWQRFEAECPKLGIEGDYKFLESLLKNVDWSTPFELFTLVVNRSRGYFMARFGASINALLNAFLDACIEFEQKKPATLEGFLNYLEASELNFKTDILGASGIRIMTVHGSKGLQAPVVILADSTDTLKPHLDPFLFFEDTKLFLLRPSQEEQTPETEPSKDLHAALLDSENKRLLYVALTRAQDQLYLTGVDRGKLNGWYGLVAKTFESLETKIGEDGTLVYEPIPFEVSLNSTEPTQNASLTTLAANFDYTPSTERASNSRDSETIEMTRGTQVHKLLEINPSAPLNNYLPWLKLDLEDQDIKSIEDLKHNPKFEYLFGSNSHSEVELYFNGSLLRIDRVVELEKEVHIIDFKTHGSSQKTEQIPHTYREQLKLYGQALQPFYPKKQIRLFLLWTDAGDLVEI